MDTKTTITWNTEVDAPCCPGQILAADGRSILIQQDTDFPGVAMTFGWSLADVEHESGCSHNATDGSVDCPLCGTSAMAFIRAAADFLAENDGAEADDPGYFT